MSGLDLKDREEAAAGNADDGLNPGNRHYNEDLLNQKKGASQDEIDQDFDGILAANDYSQNDSDSKVDAHGDTIQRNYNADENREDVQNRENNPPKTPDKETPTQSKKTEKDGAWNKLLKGFKKGGASGSVVGLIIASFGGASMILAPGALLVNIEKALTNDGSDATRTNIMMRRAYIGGLFSKKECTSKACDRMTKMSGEQKKIWEKWGFKINGAEKDGLTRVTSIESPDKRTLSNPDQFNDYAENTVEGRRNTNRVLNVRAAFFQNAKFQKVLNFFKLSKSDRLRASTDRDKNARTEAMNEDFDRKAESSPDRETRLKAVKAEVDKGKGKVAKKGIGKKILGAADLASTICMGYNITRITVATVKAKWIYDLVKFAFPFVQAAAQIEDQGNIEPEVVENLADRMTWYHTQEYAEKQVASGEDPNALKKVNKTAMDAEGIQAAIYGDFGKLDEITKQYTTPALALAISGRSIATFLEGLAGGKEKLHSICQGAYAGSLLSSAQCVTGPVQVAVCAAVVGGMLVFGDEIIETIVNKMAEPAMNFIADANLSSELKGVDAGNALAAGLGLMLTSSSMGYGLKPAASLASVNSFIAATDEVNYQYTTQIALDEAKEQPFDVSNQYSFMGQIASAFNPYRSNDGTIFSQLLNGYAVLATPLATMSTAGALYSQPSNMTRTADSAANRLSCAADCKGNNIDPEMAEIGAVNDWSGRMVGVTSGAVLSLAQGQATGQNNMIQDNIDYMIQNKYVDENGRPIDKNGQPSTESTKIEDDSDYGKYKKYCTEERVDPLGTTSKSIEDGDEEDQKWFTGERCLGKEQKDQTMLDNFAIYINICESQYATAENRENCWDDTVKPAAAVTPSTGDWVVPTSGPCLSPYGPRWGTMHAGIDISPPSGTPIVAPTDMTITYSGYNSGGYGNMVTGKADDGSEYSFRFGHMLNSNTPAAGTKVKKGDQIGLVGSTGDSSGPHLHFEIFPPGGNPATFSGAIDPVPVLAQHGVNISCS